MRQDLIIGKAQLGNVVSIRADRLHGRVSVPAGSDRRNLQWEILLKLLKGGAGIIGSSQITEICFFRQRIAVVKG